MALLSSRVSKGSHSGEHDAVKLKCAQCNRVLSVERQKKQLHLFDRVKEESPSAYGSAIRIKCSYCGAINTIDRQAISAPNVDPQEQQNACVAITKEVMRENIMKALKHFYPRYRAYNGGYLAPVRDRDPDLFMQILTELEQEGIIEYNDTQIALRLSEKYLKSCQEVR